MVKTNLKDAIDDLDPGTAYEFTMMGVCDGFRVVANGGCFRMNDDGSAFFVADEYKAEVSREVSHSVSGDTEIATFSYKKNPGSFRIISRARLVGWRPINVHEMRVETTKTVQPCPKDERASLWRRIFD